MSDTVLESIKKQITPKGVAKFVVASSVRFVVTATITALVPVDSKTDKVKLFVGSYVIASIVADKAKSYISDEIDDITETVTEIVQAQASMTKTDTPNP